MAEKAKPFRAGNEVSVRHGVYSNRRVDPLAQEFIAGLVADRPEVGAWPETVAAWARAEARCLLLSEYLLDVGFGSDRGEKALRLVGQFERLAVEMRSRLGLDPRSEAELVRDRADAARSTVDLDAIRQRGREALTATIDVEAEDQ